MGAIHIDRRDFLRLTGAGAVAAALPVTVSSTAAATEAVPTSTARYRFASTRLRAPGRQNNQIGGSAALYRIVAGSPAYPVRNPRVLLPGFWCRIDGGNPTEQMSENAFSVAYAIEIGGVRYRATFQGEPWTQRGGDGASHGYDTPYDWGVWSDPIPVEIPANSEIFHCTLVTIERGLLFPGMSSLLADSPVGDRARVSDDVAGLEGLLDSGAPVESAGWTRYEYKPMFMVAESESTDPAVLITGDSRSVGDALGKYTPRGVSGAPERGLDSITGGRIASGHIGVSGSRTSGTNIGPGMTHRVAGLLALAEEYGHLPFTHILDQHGNNGLAWSDLAAHVATLKQFFPDVPYVKVTIPPRVANSSDAYRTLAGQQPWASDTYPDGARAQYNNDILANRDGLFDAVFHAGKYGMAGDDTDFNRSRFPEFTDRTGVLTRDYDGTSTTLHLDFQPLPGDLLNFDPSNRNQFGEVLSAAPSGTPGEWEVTLAGSPWGGGGPYPAGTSFASVPTRDGTHESAQMHLVETAAYEDMKLAGIFGPIGGDSGEPPPLDVLAAAADAYVRGGVYGDDNFGGSASLMVKTDPNPDFHREALVKFDLSQVDGVLAGAILTIQANVSDSAGEAIDVEVYATGSDWAEDTVTWNSRPALGAHLGSAHVVSEPATYEVDLTGYVLDQLAAGHDEVGIAIRQEPPSGRGLATFITSRLDPANGPRLQLTYGDRDVRFADVAAMVDEYFLAGVIDQGEQHRLHAQLAVADRAVAMGNTRVAERALGRFRSVALNIADELANAKLVAAADALLADL